MRHGRPEEASSLPETRLLPPNPSVGRPADQARQPRPDVRRPANRRDPGVRSGVPDPLRGPLPPVREQTPGETHRPERRAIEPPTIEATTRDRSSSQPARALGAVALSVALAHGVNDAYAAFLAPLLPRIMDKLGLSIALAATLAMTLSLAASLLQPLMGYLSDHLGRRVFVAAGPLVSGIFLSLIGWAPTFWILVGCLALGGLGSAAFHPPGASMAARVSEGKGSGLRLSVFSFGGAMGFAVGPLVAVGIVAAVGLEGLWVAMFPGVLLGLLLLWLLPREPRHDGARRLPSPSRIAARLRGPLGLVFGISAVGAFVQRVFLTLDPIIVADAGGSEATGAVILSVYLASQGAGTLTGGILTDRVDRTRLLVGMTLLALPVHLLAVGLPPGTSLAFAAVAAAGFTNMAILPPVVVMAQEMVPEGAAVSSGIVMGLAWAAGSVGVIGAGALGDVVGARSAALLAMPVILLGTLLALHPALRRHRRPA